MNKKEKLIERAKKLKKDIPTVFLCLKDKDTPIFVKILGAVTVAYALSPIDLVPDFIPVLGYLDDIIILPLLVSITVRFIPPDVWKKNFALAEDMWKDGKPKKWYFAIPIIIVWLLILWLIIKAIFF